MTIDIDDLLELPVEAPPLLAVAPPFGLEESLEPEEPLPEEVPSPLAEPLEEPDESPEELEEPPLGPPRRSNGMGLEPTSRLAKAGMVGNVRVDMRPKEAKRRKDIE